MNDAKNKIKIKIKIRKQYTGTNKKIGTKMEIDFPKVQFANKEQY